MDRIERFLIYVKEKIKRQLHISDKPFREKVAFHLYEIYCLFLVVLVFALLFEGVALFSAKSKTEVSSIGEDFGYFFLALAILGFIVCFHYEFRVVSKIKDFDSITQYKYLVTRKLIFNVMIFGLIFYICFLAWFLWVTSLKPEIANSLILSMISTLVFSVSIGIISAIVPWMFLQSNEEQLIELNFTLIQNFESIAGHYESWTPVDVLKFLMKPIVHESEKSVNQCLNISKEFPSHFYYSFSILCLASILGNAKQKKKAKGYFAKLGVILVEKQRKNSSEAKRILEHLEKVETESSFVDFRKIQDTFGFQYSFEHFRTRIGKNGQIILGIVTAVPAIIDIIIYLLQHT